MRDINVFFHTCKLSSWEIKRFIIISLDILLQVNTLFYTQHFSLLYHSLEFAVYSERFLVET